MKHLFACAVFAAMTLAAPAKEEKKEDPRKVRKEQREKETAAIKAFLAAKDTDNDKQISKQEFIANEADQAAATQKFDAANTNGDRFLTKREIKKVLGL
ncbi:MAG: hypothetical protein V4733_07930 [Verrucomicrobiota bacterium]